MFFALNFAVCDSAKFIGHTAGPPRAQYHSRSLSQNHNGLTESSSECNRIKKRKKTFYFQVAVNEMMQHESLVAKLRALMSSLGWPGSAISIASTAAVLSSTTDMSWPRPIVWKGEFDFFDAQKKRTKIDLLWVLIGFLFTPPWPHRPTTLRGIHTQRTSLPSSGGCLISSWLDANQRLSLSMIFASKKGTYSVEITLRTAKKEATNDY